MNPPPTSDPPSREWSRSTRICSPEPDEFDVRPVPYDVRTEDGFVRFQREYKGWAIGWVYRHRGSTVRDEQTAEGIVQNAFGSLYARRAAIRENPRGALIGQLLNALREHDGREVPVGSLGARSADSEIGIPIQGRYSESPSNEYSAKEVGAAFSAGVALLRPRLREVHDLRMQGLTLWETARRLGITPDAAEKRDEAARLFLTLYMAKYDPGIALANAGIAKKKPMKSARAAKKAIALLPSLCSRLVWTVYFAGFPVERAWVKEGCSSVSEAKDLLEQGLEILSLLYDQKMPDELLKALGTNTPVEDLNADP